LVIVKLNVASANEVSGATSESAVALQNSRQKSEVLNQKRIFNYKNLDIAVIQ
jgi:hypothetical protein